MADAVGNFGIGAIAGGLTLSASWALFWSAVAMIGWSRGACGGRVLLNSLAAGLVPLLMVWVLFWMRGAAPVSNAGFVAGLFVMPLALIGFGLRPTPDGRKAGAHMLETMRYQMDEILGRHHECGGCDHDHEGHESGGCG
jgi:hypothetical protein